MHLIRLPLRWFIALLCVLAAPTTLGGQELTFSNYDSESGLSQNSCYAIEQDKYGFMWFGTQDGLNRYDGREFKVYSRNNSAGRKLPSSIITSLFYDTNRHFLWVGTVQGACIYSANGDSLMRVSEYFPLAAQLDHLPIKKIISFTPNEYWVITFTYGLIYVNTRTQRVQHYFNGEEDKMNVTSIAMNSGTIYVSLLYSLHIMHSNGPSYYPKQVQAGYPFPQIRELYSYQHDLWVGTMTEGCLLLSDDASGKDTVFQSGLFKSGIGAFCTDKQNNLWVATRGNGIYRYNSSTRKIEHAVNKPFDKTSPISNYALAAFTDRQGNAWFGFFAGIAKHNTLRYPFNNITAATSYRGSLADNMVVRMFETRDGTAFVGTLNKGMLQWNRSNNEFIRYPESEVYGNANNVIYDMAEDDNGNIWAASCGGLMYANRNTRRITYYPEKKLPELNKMYSVVKLKRKDSLLIASENGLRFFSLKDKTWRTLPSNAKLTTFVGGLYVYTARFIYEDEDNALWICTIGSGLVRYRYLTNEFDFIEPVKEKSLFIRHLLPHGNIFWLATDDGLLIYDWRANKILHHGLPDTSGNSNVCYAVERDRQGYYWVSTNLGLYKFNSRYEVIQKYNTGNGLRFLEYNTACSLNDSSLGMYFGGVGGITHVLDGRVQTSGYSPQPVLTAIEVNNKPFPLHMHPATLKRLHLDYNENFVRINFAVLNFANEANNLFSYRLNGLMPGWSSPTTLTSATFTSLPYGDYVFELKSANSDGVWSNEVRRLVISITPPWWKQWWVVTFTALALLTFVVWMMKRRERKLRQEAAMQQQLAEMEIKGLHAQMNPHFIFNSLNSIKEMILLDRKQQASRYLSKFARLIRTSLEQSRQTFISVQECADHLMQYLEMENIRFDNFTYAISISESLDAHETRIAPMLIQPLVENALWHGLLRKAGDKKLAVRFLRDNNTLICEIDDNGVGINESMKGKDSSLQLHRSIGISNVKERLQVLRDKYDMEGELTITDKTELGDAGESGTLAVLKISFKDTLP